MVEGPTASAQNPIENEESNLQLNSAPYAPGEMARPIPSRQNPLQL